MKLTNLVRTLQTLRHLRPRQAALQVRHRLVGPARTPGRPLSGGVEDVFLAARMHSPSPEGVLDERGAVSLFSSAPYDPLADGWGETRDPLWTYTLHYHGWLDQLSPDDAEATALSWIAEHRRGVGWEPYPTSMRLLHWLGWLHREGGTRQAGPRERILDSMAAQLQHLAEHVEEHIDGNHVWTNLAALTACGLGLRGPLARALTRRFADRFAALVRAQLFSDGVHRERTPTYHCLLAEQLGIVVGLAEHARPALAESLAPMLEAMIVATGSFTHPDGDVALFGDSQLDAPVTPRSLAKRFASTLPQGHALAPDGGFARRVWGPWTLLWTFGGVGMPWQTGHAHGDALAIELSLGDERIVLDAGVGTYVAGAERTYARSTRAHNTATVGYGAPDQHELWASHRVGRRAVPELVSADDVLLEGRVRGVDSPSTHVRSIAYAGGTLIVTDRVEPNGPATVRWFVPGTAEVTVDGGTARVTTAAGTRFSIESNAAGLCRTRADGWHGMGRSAPRIAIVATIPERGLSTRFTTNA